MIRSFRHKGLETFFQTNRTQGIDPTHAKRLLPRLLAMNVATAPADLDMPGWSLHELKGDRQGTWSLKVTAQWRLTFRWDDQAYDCLDVDYEQYH